MNAKIIYKYNDRITLEVSTNQHLDVNYQLHRLMDDLIELSEEAGEWEWFGKEEKEEDKPNE